MNLTHATVTRERLVISTSPIVRLAAVLFIATLRNWKALAVTLGMPLFMLFTLWVPMLAGDAESEAMMQLLFPAIILLTVIMPGLTQATRLTRWKEQRILQRLALTPAPLGSLMLGASLTQILIGVAQGALMLLFGVFLVGLDLSWQSALLVLGVMILAAAAFIAFGAVIAAFSRKAEIAGYVFFFSVMPLTFLASFPPEMMPPSLNAITPWLPTSMALELIGSLFLTNQLSGDAPIAAAGLLGYAALLAVISARKLRWEA